MKEKSSSRLMVKVLTGLMLFVFLIMFVFVLPQASSAAQMSDGAPGHSVVDVSSAIGSPSDTIESSNELTQATFIAKSISELNNKLTTPIIKQITNPVNSEITPDAVLIKAITSTKPATTSAKIITQNVAKPTPLAIVKSVTIPIPKAVTKPGSSVVTKPITKPVNKLIAKPIIKPITKPVVKPVTPPVTKPVITVPPATKPPVTVPPATKPPVTAPPATKPPVTTPPATKPPVTTPPATKPPVTSPPVTKPAEVYFRVTYVIDGETVKSEKVIKNAAGKPPSIPEKSGYCCDGWNKSVSKVVSDMTVTAVYTKIAVSMPAGADEVFTVKTSSGTVKVYGTIDEAESKAAFNLVNNYRVSKGIPALKWSDRYFQAAKQRAAECMIKFSHTRPNGSSCITVDTGIHITGENLAMGHGSPSRFFDAMKNSSGHNDNLLRSSYKLSAIAVFKFDGYVFWAEMFGY